MTDGGTSLNDWRDYRLKVLEQLDHLATGMEKQEQALRSMQIEFARLETKMAVWSTVAMLVATVLSTAIVRFLIK